MKKGNSDIIISFLFSICVFNTDLKKINYEG